MRLSAETLRAHGFGSHQVASDDTHAYDLAKQAVAGLGEAVADATALIYATALPINANLGSHEAFVASRDARELADFPASRLQAELALDRASVVGLSQQACTGMLGTLRLARAPLLAEPAQARILCVSADRFPRGARYEQAMCLVSDAASAALMSRHAEGYRILACHALTVGALARAGDDEMAGTYFSFAHRIITETVAAAGLTLAEVDWIVPQNTTPRVWQILSRALKFPVERVAMGTVAQLGHAISSDNLANLEALERTGGLQSGQKLLLFMASFGMNWQGIVLERV
ncbi:MAG: 3-oxoacyl-[acyl-carrier-protein] synthase III C-terminal domain-containing protein [Candidatus Sericytochromatia bacterium]|nr:3-oxoacyl-[acyl-carrier-protein] synthase III C-terminal domain-containing protein [Candidatus Sericytochromatia bacterium]